MTAPIQEPNLYRHASGLQWGQNQLFRRPGPVAGNDDRPWCRVAKPFVDGTFYPNQTILNNTDATLDFDETYNIAVGESGEPYFTTLGGPPVNAIRMEVQGLYSITAEVYWNEAANFPWNMAFSGDSMDWYHRAHTGYFDTSGAQEAMGSATFMHRYEQDEQIQVHLYQRSGGSRTIIAAYLEVVYMGSWTGPAFNDILPRQ